MYLYVLKDESPPLKKTLKSDTCILYYKYIQFSTHAYKLITPAILLTDIIKLVFMSNSDQLNNQLISPTCICTIVYHHDLPLQ